MFRLLPIEKRWKLGSAAHTDYAGSDPLSHGDESQSGESPSRLRYPIEATPLSLEPTKIKGFHTGIEYVRKYYSAFSEGKYS